MKLLIVAPYFHPKVGGMENYAWNICKGLQDKYGWEIVAIAANHTANTYAEETVEGVKIYRLPYWLKLSNTPINFGWFIDISNIIQKEKPDIVNGHTPVPFISDVSAIVSTFFKIPFILTYQNDLVKNNYLDLIFKVYYATLGRLTFVLSKQIIASSQYYADKSPYLKRYLNKVKIVSPGIYLHTKKNLSTKINSVLFVGQLDKTHIHKGLFYLIDAMTVVVKSVPQAKLLVVGKGDYIEEYKKDVKSKKLTRNIQFLGYIKDTELDAMYASAAVVTLPSISESEGFGMTLIEAGAHSKPVIGSKVGGIPSIITDNYNGFLVTPQDTAMLAKRIIQILTDKKLAQTLGKNGYKEVVKKYHWSTQVEKTNQLFK